MRARTCLPILAALAFGCSMPPLGVPERTLGREPPLSPPAGEPEDEWAFALERLLDDFAEALERGDAAAMSSLLTEDVEVSLNESRPPPRKLGPVSIGREQALARLSKLVSGLDIQDATLRVKYLRPVGSASEVELSVVAEDDRGARTWLHGFGEAAASRGADGLRIARLWLHPGMRTVARIRFSEVSGPAGVARRDPSLAERGYRGLIAHGAAAGDVDNDGLIDVFSTGLASHALYRNRGNGLFEDVAQQAHVAVTGAPGGAPLFFDMDDDGDQDLFLTAVGRQSLFENLLVPDGRLEFRDVSASSGVDVESAAFSAAAGDVDGDGRPDIHVACYGAYGDVMPTTWHAASNGLADLLFLNQGSGRFREAAQERGCADARWGYASLLVDLDDDADLDLVVANDFGGPNGLYLNDGGHFRDVAAERGFGAPGYGMGLSAADPDRDGDLDLHVTASSSVAGEQVFADAERAGLPVAPALRRLIAGNTLAWNLGAARFADLSAKAGPFPGGWAWGGGFVDLDGDGWLDIYTPNGFLSGTSDVDTDAAFWRDVLAGSRDGNHDLRAFLAWQAGMLMEGASFSGHERDLVMLNMGPINRFLDVSDGSGLDSPSDGRAAVFADLDDDGDSDIFLRAMHDEAHLLFRNELASQQGFVRIALRGTRSGRDAWGAVVRVTAAGASHPGRVTAQAKLGGSGFMSQSDPRLLFNLGGDASVAAIDVTWPSGLRQQFPGVPAGTSLLITEGEPEARVVEEQPFTLAGPAPQTVASAP